MVFCNFTLLQLLFGICWSLFFFCFFFCFSNTQQACLRFSETFFKNFKEYFALEDMCSRHWCEVYVLLVATRGEEGDLGENEFKEKIK